jgi:hypothetical protein
MTLDEAIEERLKVIKLQEKLYEECCSDTSKEIIKSATDNDRQLVEWLMELKARRLLMDKVCGELAELYGSPCNYSPQDEYMLENGSCEDCCGEISDKECWFRYFHRKFNC